MLARSLVGMPAPRASSRTICSPASARRWSVGVMTVQYRVAFGKKDEVVEGPDDADVVVTIAAADAGIDPTVALHAGQAEVDRARPAALFEVLRNGERRAAISRLASRP